MNAFANFYPSQEKSITTKMTEYKTKLDMKTRELEDLKLNLVFEENETEQLKKQPAKKPSYLFNNHLKF